jgi:hypothetical protein
MCPALVPRSHRSVVQTIGPLLGVHRFLASIAGELSFGGKGMTFHKREVRIQSRRRIDAQVLKTYLGAGARENLPRYAVVEEQKKHASARAYK